MPLIRNETLERIELPAEGEYAMVKPRPSVGEAKRLESMGVEFELQARISGDGSKKVKGKVKSDQDVSIPFTADTYERMHFLGLEIGVKQLCVSTGPGKPPEIIDNPTPDDLRALDVASFDALTVGINELWEQRSDDERGNSSDDGATPHKESKAPTAQKS